MKTTTLLAFGLTLALSAYAQPRKDFEKCVTRGKSAWLEISLSRGSPNTFRALMTIDAHHIDGTVNSSTHEVQRTKSIPGEVAYITPSAQFGLSLTYEAGPGNHPGRILAVPSMKGSLNEHLVCTSLLP